MSNISERISHGNERQYRKLMSNVKKTQKAKKKACVSVKNSCLRLVSSDKKRADNDGYRYIF